MSAIEDIIKLHHDYKILNPRDTQESGLILFRC